MRDSLTRKAATKNDFRWFPELDRLLIVGIKHGPAAKHETINRILKLVPKVFGEKLANWIMVNKGTTQGCVAGRGTGGSATTVLIDPICGAIGSVCARLDAAAKSAASNQMAIAARSPVFIRLLLWAKLGAE
jgi:hypothetical protein